MITIGVLLYGDYPQLARRVLTPIAELYYSGRAHVRVGCNDVSLATQEVIDQIFKQGLLEAIPKVQLVMASRPQLYKYPMMRYLFHTLPLATTEYIMWFDDDSYIKEEPILWLDKLEDKLQQEPKPDLLGSIYTIPFTQAQRAWVKTQPWYRGKPISRRPRFVTGGWWVLRTHLFYQYDWPLPELNHRGGDVALGILADQNDWQVVQYREGIAINADDSGNESKAPRRGHDEEPIGTDYSSGISL